MGGLRKVRESPLGTEMHLRVRADKLDSLFDNIEYRIEARDMAHVRRTRHVDSVKKAQDYKSLYDLSKEDDLVRRPGDNTIAD